MLLHITGDSAMVQYINTRIGSEWTKGKFSWISKNENCAREKNSGKVVRLSDNLVITGTGSVTFAHFSEEFLHFLARHLGNQG